MSLLLICHLNRLSWSACIQGRQIICLVFVHSVVFSLFFILIRRLKIHPHRLLVLDIDILGLHLIAVSLLINLSISFLGLRSLLAIVPCTMEATHGVLVLPYLNIIRPCRRRGHLCWNALISRLRWLLWQGFGCVSGIWFGGGALGIAINHNPMRLAHFLLDFIRITSLLLRKIPNLKLLILDRFLVAGKLLVMTRLLLLFLTTLINIFQVRLVLQHRHLKLLLGLLPAFW